VDWRLLPILALLHGFSLIDRNNLGIIRVAGAGTALGLGIGERYTIVTVMFFVPFILFGTPYSVIIMLNSTNVAFISRTSCEYLHSQNWTPYILECCGILVGNNLSMQWVCQDMGTTRWSPCSPWSF
jgi:hypothetical protein